MITRLASPFVFCMVFVASGFIASEVRADYIDMDTAYLRTLDKVTGRTASLNLKIGEKTQFGTLTVGVKVCKTKPPEETPENAAFLEIYNLEKKEVEPTRIFSGWMFSSSPALSALESSVYDVWLVKCIGNPVLKQEENPSKNELDDSEPEVIINEDISGNRYTHTDDEESENVDESNVKHGKDNDEVEDNDGTSDETDGNVDTQVIPETGAKSEILHDKTEHEAFDNGGGAESSVLQKPISLIENVQGVSEDEQAEVQINRSDIMGGRVLFNRPAAIQE